MTFAALRERQERDHWTQPGFAQEVARLIKLVQESEARMSQIKRSTALSEIDENSSVDGERIARVINSYRAVFGQQRVMIAHSLYTDTATLLDYMERELKAAQQQPADVAGQDPRTAQQVAQDEDDADTRATLESVRPL